MVLSPMMSVYTKIIHGLDWLGHQCHLYESANCEECGSPRTPVVSYVSSNTGDVGDVGDVAPWRGSVGPVFMVSPHQPNSVGHGDFQC